MEFWASPLEYGCIRLYGHQVSLWLECVLPGPASPENPYPISDQNIHFSMPYKDLTLKKYTPYEVRESGQLKIRYQLYMYMGELSRAMELYPCSLFC